MVHDWCHNRAGTVHAGAVDQLVGGGKNISAGADIEARRPRLQMAREHPSASSPGLCQAAREQGKCGPGIHPWGQQQSHGHGKETEAVERQEEQCGRQGFQDEHRGARSCHLSGSCLPSLHYCKCVGTRECWPGFLSFTRVFLGCTLVVGAFCSYNWIIFHCCHCDVASIVALLYFSHST